MAAFSNLAQATAWVFDLQKYGIKFGLSSTLNLLSRLDLPWEEGRYVHIAGTNGKGSVAAMLSAVLTQAGYPVGLFTSPHLVRFQERYRLRDQDVSGIRLLELINRVRARRSIIDEASPPPFSSSPRPWPCSTFFRSRRLPSSWKPAWAGGWTPPTSSIPW